jgi:hypothetical protein
MGVGLDLVYSRRTACVSWLDVIGWSVIARMASANRARLQILAAQGCRVIAPAVTPGASRRVPISGAMGAVGGSVRLTATLPPPALVGIAVGVIPVTEDVYASEVPCAGHVKSSRFMLATTRPSAVTVWYWSVCLL